MAILRRDLLHRSLLLAGAGIVGAPMTAQAQAKVAQKLVHYQSFPKNGQACATCEYFEPPDSCKRVEGTISAAGWCDLWKQKS